MRRSLTLAVVIGVGSMLLTGPVATADSTTTTTSTTSTTIPGSTTTLPTTTTTAPKVPVAPLTGLPDATKATRDRSALTIKIDNTPEAQPQFGVEDADVVYEEVVEGGITRLAAIFNSHVPSVVGPVRSVRRTDRELVWPIGGIFACSGGAEYALRSIATAPVKVIDEANAGAAMYRDPQREVPHNLLANAQLLMAKDGKPRPPPALFEYLPAGERAHGPKVSAFTVNFEGGYAVTYNWDTKTKSWDRSIFGSADVSANGVRISPKNVVVMTVNYVGGAGVIDSYAQLVGSGPAEIFTGGVVQHGTWSRNKLIHRAYFKNHQGKLIELNPGQTFVELLPVGEGVSITS
jgi:hypothetical protein